MIRRPTRYTQIHNTKIFRYTPDEKRQKSGKIRDYIIGRAEYLVQTYHGETSDKFRELRERENDWIQTCALPIRSEEHTSELQSHLNLVCRLLLEKKKKNT